MFYNTTTLWRNNDFHTSFVKEKRMPRMAAEKAKAALAASGSGLKVFGKGLWKGFKWVTTPARMVLWPITKPLSLGIKYIPKFTDKLKIPVKATREAIGGVFKGSIYGGIKELVKAPFIFIKKNLVDNFRDVLKGVFQTPGNILRIPKNIGLGFMNGISQTRSRVKKVIGNVLTGHPLRAIGNTALLPFTAAAIPLRTISKPITELAKPGKPVAENIKDAYMAYPNGLVESGRNIKKGIDRVSNCVATAKAEVAAEQEGGAEVISLAERRAEKKKDNKKDEIGEVREAA